MRAEDCWTKECWDVAANEGWVLSNWDFGDGDVVWISRIDNPADWEDLPFEDPKFEGDLEAQEFVAETALEGSRVHLLALFLQMTPVYFENCIVPTCLLED